VDRWVRSVGFSSARAVLDGRRNEMMEIAGLAFDRDGIGITRY
jgi:hypothetical protein